MTDYKQQVIQAVRRDEAERQRLLRRVAPLLPHAFDEADMELTTAQLAEKVLKKLGLEVPKNGETVAALNAWLTGREHGAARDRINGVRSSMDARPGGSFVDNYIAGR